MGCDTFDERQRAWIFQRRPQPGRSAALAQDMDEVWIEFGSKVTGRARPATRAVARLQELRRAPVLLHLHCARWNESVSIRARWGSGVEVNQRAGQHAELDDR